MSKSKNKAPEAQQLIDYLLGDDQVEETLSSQDENSSEDMEKSQVPQGTMPAFMSVDEVKELMPEGPMHLLSETLAGLKNKDPQKKPTPDLGLAALLFGEGAPHGNTRTKVHQEDASHGTRSSIEKPKGFSEQPIAELPSGLFRDPSSLSLVRKVKTDESSTNDAPPQDDTHAGDSLTLGSVSHTKKNLENKKEASSDEGKESGQELMETDPTLYLLAIKNEQIQEDLKEMKKAVDPGLDQVVANKREKVAPQTKGASVNSREPSKRTQTEISLNKKDKGNLPKTLRPSQVKRSENIEAAEVRSYSASSAEAALIQSEALRLAQARIDELENELDRYRKESDELSSAGDVLKRSLEETAAQLESTRSTLDNERLMYREERELLREQIKNQEVESHTLREKAEELEGRIEANFKKIRVRERELEHRLEIMKLENTSLVENKDKMILKLKRQIDQLELELDSGRQRTQELFHKNSEKQETIQRVVRALRIAMTILEGEEAAPRPLKKAE